ncbi:Cache 3/Cache 2 fusion domain-containing protein [Neiella sp. HB171785]|uniref:Cache 3/Cache 2 fusion domain-containing protein n=1 Tax=Neiella litorisoli TaxID=2771431 RepID=A0A8J6UDG8_9GAMM|nr:Cache 3/Cache 2 fusion domain-containing protein [Neiella litorisoli]MBD1387839.1 Cache 3/Cache 2 fusion domain-containing protein [Neiella litorisoli]
MVQQLLQLSSVQQLKLAIMSLIMLFTAATTAMVFDQFYHLDDETEVGAACPVEQPTQLNGSMEYGATLDRVRQQLQGWREHELINLSATQRRELVDGVEVNQLLVNGVPVSANLEMVDRFLEKTGSHATVFVREGRDFVRVATTLSRDDGSRAVGSFLGHQHAGYRNLMAGNEFSNRVTLFGDSYIACYFPLMKNGEVYAVIFAGLPMESVVQDIFAPLEDMGLGQIDEHKKADILRLM